MNKTTQKTKIIFTIGPATESEETLEAMINEGVDICRINNVKCMNVFKNLNLTVADTYDLIHLNPKGSSKLSNFILNEFLKFTYYK